MEKRANKINLTEKVRENIKEKLIVLGVFDVRKEKYFLEASKLCSLSASTLWSIWNDYMKKSICLSTFDKINTAYNTKCIEKNIKPVENVGAPKPRGTVEYVVKVPPIEVDTSGFEPKVKYFDCLNCKDGSNIKWWTDCPKCQEPQTPEYEKSFDCSTPDKHLGREKELVSKLRAIMNEFETVANVLEREFIKIQIIKTNSIYDVIATKTITKEINL